MLRGCRAGLSADTESLDDRPRRRSLDEECEQDDPEGDPLQEIAIGRIGR
jgi:hypothetical protein